MRTSRGLPSALATAVMVLLVGGAALGAGPVAANVVTAWGEPDLRGVYSGPPAPCLSRLRSDEFPPVLSPIHIGATRIDQWPGLVRIRNPFTRTRMIETGTEAFGYGERGTWEGNSLVIHTSEPVPRSIELVGAGGLPLAPVGITERFTRLDAQTVEYQYTVLAPTYAAAWPTITMPLARRVASATRNARRTGLCAAATVD